MYCDGQNWKVLKEHFPDGYADMTAIKSKVDVSGIIGYQVLKECISYFDFDSEKISVSLNN